MKSTNKGNYKQQVAIVHSCTHSNLLIDKTGFQCPLKYLSPIPIINIFAISIRDTSAQTSCQRISTNE